MDAKQGSGAPAGAPSSHPVAVVAAQLGAALLLHLVLSLLLGLLAPSEVDASLGLRPLAESAPGEVLAGWAVLTGGPAAAWALLVLARTAVRRTASGFWFAIAAGLVAVGAFALVLGTGNGSPAGPGPALVAAAWLMVPCAIVVAALTAAVAAWHRRADRSAAAPSSSA